MSSFLSGRTSLTTVQTGDIADDAVTEAKMATDAIGLTELKAGTDGELLTWDASGNPSAVPVGTATHILTSRGAGSTPTFQAPAGGGKLLKSHYYQNGVAATSTNTTPFDDTVPTISEGYEYMTTNFTPLSATSTLHISVVATVGCNTLTSSMMCLHNGGAALVTNRQYLAAGEHITMVINHAIASPGTSQQTFSVRIGAATGRIYFNTDPSYDFGGTHASSITVYEVEA